MNGPTAEEPEVESADPTRLAFIVGYLVYFAAVGIMTYLAASYIRLFNLASGFTPEHDVEIEWVHSGGAVWFRKRMKLLAGLAVSNMLISLYQIYSNWYTCELRWLTRFFFVSMSLITALTATLYSCTRLHFIHQDNNIDSVVKHLRLLAMGFLIVLAFELAWALIYVPWREIVPGSKPWGKGVLSFLTTTLLDDIILGVTWPIWLLIDVSIRMVLCILKEQSFGYDELGVSYAIVTGRFDIARFNHSQRERWYDIRYGFYVWWVKCWRGRSWRKKQTSASVATNETGLEMNNI